MAEPTFPAADVRALLSAIREAIALPGGETYEDEARRRRILDRRMGVLDVVLERVLEDGVGSSLTLAWRAEQLRRQVSTHPAAGYTVSGRCEAGGLAGPAAAAPTTTAEILREAARVARSQAPTVLGVAQTIRLAAGGDAAGRARAEAALLVAAYHIEPGIRVDDLERWRDRRTCLQVAEALELAAAAAEQGGDR
ncbi:hypothetical protein ACLQ2R_17690 [Streptosporangium sp. DT93]|uniref:hypothetical protein n=1 Tax=Streptosporangium sp. DT93 TaxID=3393428 RepID=UPI003CEE778C